MTDFKISTTSDEQDAGLAAQLDAYNAHNLQNQLADVAAFVSFIMESSFNAWALEKAETDLAVAITEAKLGDPAKLQAVAADFAAKKDDLRAAAEARLDANLAESVKR